MRGLVHLGHCYPMHRPFFAEAEIELFPRPDRVPDRDFAAEVLPETVRITAGGGYPVPIPDCE